MEALLKASRKIGQEVNTEEATYMVMSNHKNA